VDDENEWYAEVDLTQAKLNVLERQGQTEEYLQLCQQAGEHQRYTLKLLEGGVLRRQLHKPYQKCPISVVKHVLELQY